MEFQDEATYVVFSPTGTGPYPAAHEIDDHSLAGQVSQRYCWDDLWLADQIYAQDRASGGTHYLESMEWPLWAQRMIRARYSHSDGLSGARAYQVKRDAVIILVS